MVIAADQVPVNIASLGQGGVLIEPSQIDESSLPNKKSINVALLGALSRYLPFSFEAWTAALLALREQGTTVWDFTARTRVRDSFPKLKAQMLPDGP